LLLGRRSDAELEARLALPASWPDTHDERFLTRKLAQMREDPQLQQWVMRALVLPDGERPMIGHAGFHGAPGINSVKASDAVEVGYSVFPPYREQGFATEAVRGLVRWASEEHGVRRFIASVAPDNAPSLALVQRLGFVETGRHWDDEDGDELEFELRL
jgi:ribosomal-protein-alanine N-acetyltransferase